MARLPRLALDGQLHHVVHRAAPEGRSAPEETDRSAYLQALLSVSRDLRVAVHAYAVLPDRVQLLMTPPTGAALTVLMQRVGRRYVGGWQLRHGSAGTPWAGRYRVAVLQPERHLIDAMRLVDTAARRDGLVDDAAAWAACSAAHHVGRRVDPVVTDHPAYWALGNTPFERELAYRRLCEEPLADRVQAAIERATEGGWVLGDAGFVERLGATQARPLLPRARGRPPKAPGRHQSDPN